MGVVRSGVCCLNKQPNLTNLIRENAMKEVYCNGCGYTKVWFDDVLEACVNQENLDITAYLHTDTHTVFGIPTELTQEQILIVKIQYNQYWKDFNDKYPKHAKPLFEIGE